MPLANVIDAVSLQLQVQGLVSFATFQDLVESHWLPLGAIVACVAGRSILRELSRLDDGVFVDALDTVFAAQL